jgi:LysM repeat protein
LRRSSGLLPAGLRHRDTLPAMDEPTSEVLPGSDAHLEPAEPQTALPETAICPFLVSATGPWRSPEPARDHRCSMAARSTRLDLDHQRRYCVGSGGPGCVRYVPARAPGRLVTTLPVVVDRGPFSVTMEREGLRRLAGPASVVVVGAAIGAFLLARGPGAPAPAPAVPSAPPGSTPSSPPASAAPSKVPARTPPAPTPAPVPSASPMPSPSAVPAPSPSTAPSSGRTYTVRRGDTLGAIAARFGTTTAVLAQLNAIADPSFIRVGQVLQLP